MRFSREGRSDIPFLIHDIKRRPVSILQAVPVIVTIIQHLRITHMVLRHGFPHLISVFLVVEFGAMDAYDLKVREFLVQRNNPGQRSVRIPARKGPDVQQNHFPMQISPAQGF